MNSFKPVESANEPLWVGDINTTADANKLRQSWIGDYTHVRSAAHRAYCRAPGRPQTAAFCRDYFEPKRSPSFPDEERLHDCILTLKAAIGHREVGDIDVKERSKEPGMIRGISSKHVAVTSISPERCWSTKQKCRPLSTRVKITRQASDTTENSKQTLVGLEGDELVSAVKSTNSADANNGDASKMMMADDDVKEDSMPSDIISTACLANNQDIIVYHFIDSNSYKLSSNDCSAIEDESKRISSWNCGHKNKNVASYCVEVQGDGHKSTPGLADQGSPANEILLELLRKQLTLSDHPSVQDDESLTLHVDSLNALVSRIVNAKPPNGHLYYFAYGPDINTERFSTYIKRCHNDTTWAFLYGFKMADSSVEIDSQMWPQIEFSPHCAVEGRLYVITRQEAIVLDNHLRNTSSFLSILLPVWLVDGNSDCSTSEFCLPALVHVPPNLLLK